MYFPKQWPNGFVSWMTHSHTHSHSISKASHGIKGLVSWQRETPLNAERQLDDQKQFCLSKCRCYSVCGRFQGLSGEDGSSCRTWSPEPCQWLSLFPGMSSWCLLISLRACWCLRSHTWFEQETHGLWPMRSLHRTPDFLWVFIRGGHPATQAVAVTCGECWQVCSL